MGEIFFPSVGTTTMAQQDVQEIRDIVAAMQEKVLEMSAIIHTFASPTLVPSPSVFVASLGEDQVTKSEVVSVVSEFDDVVATQEVYETDKMPKKDLVECQMLTSEGDVSDAHKVFDEMPISHTVDYIKVCPLPFELQFLAPHVDDLGVVIWPTGVGTFFAIEHEVLFTVMSFIIDTDIGGLRSVDTVGVPLNHFYYGDKDFYGLEFANSVIHLCVLCSNGILSLNGITKLQIDFSIGTEHIMKFRKEGYGWVFGLRVDETVLALTWDLMGSVGMDICPTGIGTSLNLEHEILFDARSFMCYFLKCGMVFFSCTAEQDDAHHKRAHIVIHVISNTIDAKVRKLEIMKFHVPGLLYMTTARIIHETFMDIQLIIDFGLTNRLMGYCPYIDNDFVCTLNRRPDDRSLKWIWQTYTCQEVSSVVIKVVLFCPPLLKSLQLLGIDTDGTMSEEEVIYAARGAFKSMINSCIDESLIKQKIDHIMASTNTNTRMSGPTIIESICATIESLLDHPLTDVVFQVVPLVFDKLDTNSSFLLSGTLAGLTEILKLAKESLAYSNLLHECVGSVLCAMGPFLHLLSLNLKAKDLSEKNVWLFLILKLYTVGARLKFFTSEIFSMLGRIVQNSDQEMTTSSSGSMTPRSPLLHDVVCSLRTCPIHSSKDRTSMDDFGILEPLSHGAFGRDVLAKKQTTKDHFAIKVFKKEGMICENAGEHILLEHGNLISVWDPFVVRFFSSFTCCDNLYLVMEYLNRGDLYSLLRILGFLDKDVARVYIAEAVLALEYLLSKVGLINNEDLYGTAVTGTSILDVDEPPESESVGQQDRRKKRSAIDTPDYSAPELLLKKGHETSANRRYVSVILFELIVGIPVFNAEHPQAIFDNLLNRNIPWPRALYELSTELADLSDRILTEDPHMRLGARGAVEVKQYLFFKDINKRARQKASIMSSSESALDTNYFTIRFTWNTSDYNVYPASEFQDSNIGRGQEWYSTPIFGFDTCTPTKITSPGSNSATCHEDKLILSVLDCMVVQKLLQFDGLDSLGITDELERLNRILEDKNPLKGRVMIRVIYARELLELVEFHIVWIIILVGLLYIFMGFCIG